MEFLPRSAAQDSNSQTGSATVPVAPTGVPPMAPNEDAAKKEPSVSCPEAGPRDADQSARDAHDPHNESKTFCTSPRKQAILLFCILMFCYSFIHQRMGWNQNSRLDLLHALFVHKTFKIDAYHENTGDKSIANGHYYSDKAPGIVFLAIPAFAVAKGILHVLDVPLDSDKGWLASSWITTVGSVGLITALGGALMFLFLCRLVEQSIAFLTTYVVFLGSAPFPYATMLFSHATVIGLICIALWAVADDYFIRRMTRSFSFSTLGGEGRGEVVLNSRFRRYLLAGFACGLAIASEYTAAIAAGGVLALALLISFKRGIILALASIAPLLLIPAYNWICFGGPLAFGYHNLALPEFQEMNKGLFGITFPPKASAAYLILFSPARGLFFWTPFFMLAFFGMKALLAKSGKLFWVVLTVTVVQVISISGYYMPGGGAALGPRHLAPMLPLVCILSALGLRTLPRTGFLLGYAAILLTGLATLTDAMSPDGFGNPFWQYHVRKLLNGMFANMLPSYLGLPAAFSAALIGILVIAPYLAALRLLQFPVIENEANPP
jgi:hypothetical protein